MIITIGGEHGAGRSTTAKLLAEELGYDYIGVGIIFREMAQEMGMSLEDFNNYLKKHPEIDKEVDRKQMEKAKGNVVIDSNLGGYLLDADLKVWLKAPLEIRADRIAKKKRFGDTPARSIDEAKRLLEKRETAEKERYKALYGIDLGDVSPFHLVIDTSKWDQKEVIRIIITGLNALHGSKN